MTQSRTPWSATVQERTLVITLPTLYRVVSWAPLNGGFFQARTIVNHQVRTDDYPAEEPTLFLSVLARRLGLTEPVVGLMTGVLMERLVRRAARREGMLLECFATVGVSNALAVGDSATYQEKPGTINTIVVVEQSLTVEAMVEAIAVVTEAKVRVLSEARIKSTVSDRLATGTGTDCVVIACADGTPAYRYCGKHTALGELLGRVAYEAMTEGLKRAGVG